MFHGAAITRRPTEDEQPRFAMHNIEDDYARYRNVPGRSLHPEESPDSDTLAVNTPQDGLWGERDIGGPVSQRVAMEDYETLRRELTNLSNTRSRSKSQPRRSGLARAVSGRSGRRASGRRASTRDAEGDETSSQTFTEAADEEQGEKREEEDDFALDQFMREGHFEKRVENRSAKRVGVIYRNLTVKGVGSTATFVKTLPDAVIGTFGPDLYKLACRFMPFLAFGRHGPTRILINDFTGLVRDGEMMLVLGRPGSGCSTFLKAIANNREAFADVTGDVSYGGIDAKKQKKMYRGEVNYNPEDDVHFAELNVYQTFKFALLNKTKKREKGEIPVIIDALLRMFGISHTKYTKV